MNTNFVVINKANELYDYSFRYVLNSLKGKGNTFRNSLENDKKPVSGSQVLDFKQLFDSLEENRRKKK